ncbi:SMI1/KNR4 family protein [Brucella intermedia]|uniref:SMI1/KNR4 family protein n=1 Tax=Brucella intermedia TaxID=94625 RepID=UPI00124DDB67|nr:SMI1/KNR4 family protein [Brucella intermedia]KAB2721111.1 SMI1/KNR4 family protein [Brucella intermedia]
MTTEREEFDRLCQAGEVFGPVRDLAIAQAEADLGVQFPLEYRELLRNYGAVLAGGLEVYGLPNMDGNDPPLWQDVVGVTKQLREWKQVGADRESFIPICDDGRGFYFYLDTLASPATKIYAVGPGKEQAFETGLFRFLLDLSAGKVTV